MNSVKAQNNNLILIREGASDISDEIKRCLLQFDFDVLSLNYSQLSEYKSLPDYDVSANSLLVLIVEESKIEQSSLQTFPIEKHLTDRHAEIKERVEVALKRQFPACFAILCGDNASIKHGYLTSCNDFILWPCAKSELQLRINRLCSQCLPNKNAINCEGLIEEFIEYNLIGQSESFLTTLSQIKQIAKAQAPVLVEGQTGTGKELAARAIHYMGERKNFPFVPVNCGALTESLLENELFGHAKGAYTGAADTQQGLVALAERGTLFLDEVDSLSSKAQVTLLRFLQDFQYRKIGGNQFESANIRIIAASNAPLSDLVAKQEFRQDLYYRLNVMRIDMPTLSSRKGDVVLLAQHFIAQFSHRYGNTKYLDISGCEYLKSQPWLGNVRELENRVHRAYLMSNNDSMVKFESNNEYSEASKEQENSLEIQDFGRAKEKIIEEFEVDYLSTLMTLFDGNVSQAARVAGKERKSLDKLLRKRGINKDVFRMKSRVIKNN